METKLGSIMHKGITIDGKSSNDLDDAIWIEKNELGYKLSISISNVSKHIAKDSGPDQQAQVSLFSIYRGNGGCIKPMLQRKFSENKLSLLKNETRDVVIFDITLNKTLEIIDTQVSEGEFKNIHRLSHEDIPNILSNKAHELNDTLSLLSELASKLLDERRQSGAMAIYDIIAGWGTDETGNLRKLSRHECNVGYIVVQEIMVLTNVAMSQFAITNNIPIMYRNHKASIAAPEAVELSKEIQQAFSNNDEKHIQLLNKRLHLASGRATMGSVTYGHYGLNLPAYSYVTSPIRRYPDLVNHRNILAFIHGEEFPYSQSDLEVLSEKYNIREREVKDDTKNYFKEKASEKASSDFELKQFTRLDEKELYRTLKVAEEQGKSIHELMQKEIVHRLEAGNLDHKSLALVFAVIGSTFTQVNRNRIIQSIQASPHIATAVYNILMQKFDFSEIVAAESSTGPDNSPLFLCVSSIENKGMSSTPIYAKSKKISSQLATLDLLQQLINVNIQLSMKIADMPLELEQKETKKVPLIPTNNHKGDLQEWCQKNGYPVPQYETSKSGPDHSPIFKTKLSVEINGEKIQSISDKGSNKKESQKLTAKQWIEDNKSLMK